MKIIRIDSQILTSFSHCNLRCNHSFIERLKPKEESKHFAKGKVIHVAFESYYNDTINKISFKERVEKSIITANTFATTETNLPQIEIDNCIETLNQYYKYRLGDMISPITVETPFTKLLYEGKDLSDEDIQIYYEGKIDLVADLDSIRRVIDHKTTSINTEPTDLTVQFIGYHWVTGLPVIMNRVGFQKTLAPSEKFKRFPFRFHEETVEEWRKFAIRNSLRYARALETNFWEPNFASCQGNFGYHCDYVNLCRYPTIAGETKRFEFVIADKWDVFSERNT